MNIARMIMSFIALIFSVLALILSLYTFEYEAKKPAVIKEYEQRLTKIEKVLDYHYEDGIK